jgi:outer membrane lipoprotein LolB
LALALALTSLLSACVSLPRPAAAPIPSPLPWPQRLAALQAVTRFELQGRLGASTASEGFSAGLRWQQQDQHATIDLSAPLGFGAAHIELTGDALHLTTSKGLTLDGAAASDELAATLGFEPPLASLRFWILGASDPASDAQRSLDAQQRLARLQQGGWQVDYADYVLVQQQWLPRRLTVTRGSLRLRVVVDGWHL